MWTYFPVEIGTRDGRGDWVLPPNTAAWGAASGGTATLPSGPLLLTAKARPDGSAPIFPTGAQIDAWYFTGHSREDDPRGGLDRDVSRSSPVTISLNSLSWSWDEVAKCYVSNSVLTLPESTYDGWWFQDSLGVDPETGEEIFSDFYWVFDDASGTDNAVITCCGAVEGGNAAAIAVRCFGGSWANGPRGRYIVATLDALGNQETWTMFKTWRLGVSTKAGLGLFCAFTGGTDYYSTARISFSTDSAYPANATNFWGEPINIDPLLRPEGYTLTGQTTTSRTWVRGEDTVVFTLSDQVTDFSPFFPVDEIYETGVFSVEILDHGDFLTAQQFETASKWKLRTFTQGSFAGTADEYPDEVGTITLLLWSSTGTSTATISLSKLVEDYGQVRYESDSWGANKHPVAILGMTGQIATGFLDNGNSFWPWWGGTASAFRVGGSCFIRIPVPE